MTKKYILTGGPGSGKSSILLELEARGEYIVREAAEDVIKLNQSKGIVKPWELPNFQDQILDLQIQRERIIPRDIERVFIDRGILDGLAYTKPGSETYRKISEKDPHYNIVFLIENLGQTQTNGIRKENQDEALHLERKLDYIYQKFQYRVDRIKPGDISERASKILLKANFDGIGYFLLGILR